jgi:hypothetical protein
MVIDHIFSTIAFLSNKNRRGVLKHQDINLAVKSAQSDFYNDELKIYRETGIIPTSIKRFVKSTELTIINGEAALPVDFSREVSFLTDYGQEGDFLHPEAYQDRKNSYIIPPDEEFPIAKIQDSKIIIEPDDLQKITLTYFRTPVDFAYSVAVDGDGRGYTITGTTDIEFGIEYSNEIIRRALLYLGVSMQNKDVEQIGIITDKR